MQSDTHQRFQQQIDARLTAGTPMEEDRSLREHLQACAACAEYLDLNRRAISSLAGFSFAVDAGLNQTVAASLRQHARQLESMPLNGRRWILIIAAAVLCTTGGSLIDLQCGGVLASAFDIERAKVWQALLAFWIVPSLGVLLLFLLLPWLSKAGLDRKEGIV